MSDHDEMKANRLPNWGAWGRQDRDRPDPEACGRSICTDYMGEDREPGWGDDDAIPEPPAMPIDHRDAENLDGWIRQLADQHKQIIRRKFYKRLPVDIRDTDAAVRALLDLIHANRRTTRLMERMRWQR